MDGGVVFLPTHGPRRPLSLNLFATASFNPLINPQLIFCELYCLPLSLKQTRFPYDEFSLAEEKIRRAIPTTAARLDKGASRDQLSTKHCIASRDVRGTLYSL